MNINNVNGILGDAVSNEVRTLELRVGQIVRGVVLQQHPNNEATVSINGVQIRAKLEIPLMEGQASLLQVQPDSKNGQIYLKQVDPTSMGLQDPLKDILKSLSLPDRAWAHELVKDLRREGFALNKETAAAFQRAAQLMPPGANQEQWMNAAAAAFKRGLPMTASTISAMNQLQNGAPIHQLLSQLRGDIAQLLQNNSNPQLQPLLSQLSTQLAQGNNILNQLFGAGEQNLNQSSQTQQTSAQQSVPNGANQPGTGAASSVQGNTLSGASQGAGNQQVSNAGIQSSQSAAEGMSQQNSVTANVNQSGANSNQQLLPQLLKWLGVNHEAILAKSIFNQSQANAAATAPSTNAQQGTGITSPMQSLAQQAGSASLQNNANLQQTFPGGMQTNSVATGAAQQATNQAGTAQAAPAPSISSMQTTVQPGTVPFLSGEGTAASNRGQATLTQSNGQPVNIQSGSGHEANSQAANAQGAGTHQSVNSQAVNTHATNATGANSLANQAHVQTGNPQASNTAASQVAANQMNAAMQHEGQALQHSNPLQTQGHGMMPAQHAEVANASSLGQSNQTLAQESLKATIMQLIQSPDVPSGVKETAQQLLNAITGQQLMLSAERNHSMLSHVTMYIPIHDGENGQTATIHVQTRRNRKGELDSDNCRIVFDLQMKTIGQTLVDMNIVNKIVSLNLWNDHPVIAPIIDSIKPDIQAGLQNYGYLLSSVRTTPIPQKNEVSETVQEEGKAVVIPPDIDQINSTRYKGVDLKI